MKRLRWQILVVLVTLIVVAVLLVGQQPLGNLPLLPQPTSGGVYTEALVGSMGRLNPLLDWNNSADRDIDSLIYSGLIRFDSHGLPQPDLAESWGTSADGTIYNFTLRSNAVWQDGKPVTSDDIVFTIDLIKSSGSLFPQDIKDLWSEIEVKQLNDKNIKFTLPEPYAPFLDYVTFGLLPKHLLGSVSPDQLSTSDFNLKPVGTGPYRFDHLIIEGGQIRGVVLVVNENYYLAKPFIPQVVFRYYPDSVSALDAYEQGEALGVSQIGPKALEKALLDPALSVYTSRMPQLSLVFLNLNNPSVPFLQDAKVRRALLMGLNRNAMVSNFMGGEAIVADGPILPGSWAYYDGIEHIEYDPEAAASLLKADGYVLPAAGGQVREKDGQPLALALVHPDDDLHAKIAEMIQSNWAEIGVRVDLQPASYESMVGDYLSPRSYQAALVDLTMARTPDPDPYPFWHQAEATGGQNYSQWDDRTASEYIETARTLTDFTERARLYRNFQVIFAKELPSLPLYYPVYSYGVDSQVKGVQVAPLYDTSDRLSFITEWYLVTRRTLEETPAATTEP
ncbi:MAG TPA: peptide ABC transporter substrate-binding protein [Anaerolineales bacterium]